MDKMEYKMLDDMYSFTYLYNNKFYQTTPEQRKKLIKITTNSEMVGRVIRSFNLSPEHLSFQERLKAIKFGLDFFTNVDINDAINKDNKFYKIVPVSVASSHSECPFQYNIIDKEKNELASIGIYFTCNKDKSFSLRINNLQGKKYKIKELASLGNWRLEIVKKLKEFTSKNKIKIIGEFPKHFNTISIAMNDYAIQVENYFITYLKAGITPEYISLRFVENPKIKEKLNNYLKLIKNKDQKVNRLIRRIESEKYREKKPILEKEYSLEIKFPKKRLPSRIK